MYGTNIVRKFRFRPLTKGLIFTYMVLHLLRKNSAASICMKEHENIRHIRTSSVAIKRWTRATFLSA